MCPPTYFEVAYAINAWMDPTVPVDHELAIAQWHALVETYRSLGHVVHLIEPAPGLPDMVFAANCAVMTGGRILGARFRYPERTAEADLYREWFRTNGFDDYHQPVAGNEGEGDFTVVGDLVLAGTGFRTDPAAHRQAAEVLGREVISLQLCDPRFYHLDVALFALDDSTIAYLPEAFDEPSRQVLAARFPDAIVVDRDSADAFGLNSISDGRNVVVDRGARSLIAQLTATGYVPHPVDLSELRKAGGGAKCCTQEIRRADA